MDNSKIVDVYRQLETGDWVQIECMIEYRGRSQKLIVTGKVTEDIEGGLWEDDKFVIETTEGRIYHLMIVGLGGPSVDLHRVGADKRYYIDIVTALEREEASAGNGDH